jgi:hypothetical protein
MASVYSTQFFAGSLPNGGSSGPLVVPAGQLWIVRDISGVLDGPTFANQLGVRAAGVYFYGFVINPGTTPPVAFHWEGRTVVSSGETLQVDNAGSAFIDVIVSGYVLALP